MRQRQATCCRPRSGGRRVGTPLAVAAVGLLLVGVTAFPAAGRFLIAEDDFAHADTALVLSGGPTPRALAARDLYRAGRVDRVLIIPDPPGPADEELVKLGLKDPNATQISERILMASGVPKSQIAFLPHPVDGTIREAQAVREYLHGRVPESLVVITSKPASRRARFIFRRMLGNRSVRILSYPGRYDAFQADRWWTQPRNALLVVMEYQKFLANAMTLLVHPSTP